jgi:hypothetical protein
MGRDGLRRRRRSFLSIELNEPRDDRWEKADAKDRSEVDDRFSVSALVTEGAWNMEL